MKMNGLEKFFVNNPIRTFMISCILARFLKRTQTDFRGKRILEIGCGQGSGSQLLVRKALAEDIVAFDYDPSQLALAQRRHRRRGNSGIKLLVGDGQRLPFPDAHFDVVVEFAILHHMEDWRASIREIRRVLKPGGVFLYEEFLVGLITNPIIDRLFVHPESGHFTAEAFWSELDLAGFQTRERIFRLWQYWVAGAVIA